MDNLQGNGTYNSIVLEGKGPTAENPNIRPIGDSCSVHLSEVGNAATVWHVTIYVHIGQGWYQAGPEFTTNPPASGDPPSRTIAFACIPGAIGWRVDLHTPTTVNYPAALVLDSTECSGSPFGVTVNDFTP